MAAPAVMAAVVTGVKLVGTALALVSMVKGIKEGNVMQAVMGGVGAFAGLSSLSALGASAGTTLQNTAAQTAAEGMQNTAQAGGLPVSQGGTVIADQAKNAAMIEAAKQSSTFMPDLPGAEGMASVGSTATEAMTNMGGGMMDQAGMLAQQDAAFTGMGGGLMPETQSALQSIGGGAMGGGAMGGMQASGFGLQSLADAAKVPIDWIKQNPELMKIAGSALSGWQKERMLKDMWKKQEQMQKQQRDRIGYMQPIGNYMPQGV